MTTCETASLATPIGIVRIDVSDGAVTAVTILPDTLPVMAPDEPVAREAVRQLAAYFKGRLARFDLPLVPIATPRGNALREGIAAVGYGETASYGDIARRIGSSPRAIGQACARNPLPIIVPCHRILGANRVLGAYSAGEGPSTKRWLLAHEQGIRA